MPDELLISETARAFHTPVEIVVRLNRLQEQVDKIQQLVAQLSEEMGQHTHATDTPSGMSGRTCP